MRSTNVRAAAEHSVGDPVRFPLHTHRGSAPTLAGGGGFAHDDPRTVEAIRRGDEAAFDTLFRALYPRLCDYVLRYTRSPEAAEEVVQEVFTAVWEGRRAWSPRLSATQYLFGAVRNRALKHLRRQEVRERLRPVVGDLLYGSPATPDELLADGEMDDAVQEAIDALPQRCREIFLLSREGALTYREIAETLEISIKTVVTQMARALKALKSSLLRHLQ